MKFELATDVKKRLSKIQSKLKLPHIEINRIISFRSYGSRSRARARIWAFPKIWQLALDLPPYYCIEVLSEKFDQLSENNKTRVLIHELMHIPKNFSGALLPHRGRGKVKINYLAVETLFRKYQKNR